jgi:hypothetical protein
MKQLDDLDKTVSESDLVLSLIPPTMHIPVAQACLHQQVNMATPSYISLQIQELDEKALQRDIITLNAKGGRASTTGVPRRSLMPCMRKEAVPPESGLLVLACLLLKTTTILLITSFPGAPEV